MSGWSMAIGNLQPAPRAPAPAVSNKEPSSPRKKASPTFCPCCGKRMRSPDGPKPWTSEQDQALRARLAEAASHDAIATELGRPLSSIKSRIRTLNLDGKGHYGK